MIKETKLGVCPVSYTITFLKKSMDGEIMSFMPPAVNVTEGATGGVL